MSEHGIVRNAFGVDSPENDEAVDYALQNSSETTTFVPRPTEWLKPFKKESSVTTSSTLASSSKRSIESSDYPGGSCVWSNMLTECDKWHDDVQVDVGPKRSLAFESIYCLIYELRHIFQTINSHPYIPICTIGVLAVLTTVGVTIVNVACKSVVMEKQFAATSEALETGTWFADQFSNALLPLYSLQQAVAYSEYFKNLSSQIGRNSTGSGPVTERGHKFRNVAGICDDASIAKEFLEIVTSVQNNFDLDGIVLQYRLVPDNVFCLFEPLVDSDFGAGKIINSTGLVGLDLSKRPDWDQILESTYARENPITIAGPKKFSQNDAILTEEMFCAHLAVNIPGYTMTVGNRSFNSWGFVMSLIDWAQLKQNSRLFDRFKQQGIEFHLYRNDTVRGTDETEAHVKMVTIARSDNWHALTLGNFVEVSVSTPNGEWINRVGYASGFSPSWHVPVLCVVVFLALVLSMMFMMILIGRQLHRQLLFRVMPRSAVRKIHRGQTVIERYNLVTIFFSDIVDFTFIAGEMRPIQVMNMLNDLYTAFDSIIEKYGVYKVETIGDAYMVVGGAPDRIPAPEAAEKVALFALEATEFVKSFKTSMGDQISIRVGIASGPAVAGVVGKSMPRYCFFGDTVNIASRMESTSRTMRIQCSDLTFRLLNDAPNYVFAMEERRENDLIGVEVKGKGLINTWWINGAKPMKVNDADVEQDKSLDNHPASPCIEAQLETISGSISSNSSSHRNRIKNQKSQLSRENVSHSTYIQVKAISGQAWSKLGEDEGHLVAATADCDTMIDRIASMLEIKLVAVVRARDQTPLDDVTKTELRAYVAHIESLYNHVEYHSFEHASHVTISMNKLVNTNFEQISCADDRNKIDRMLCENPFISFMMVYSALVHDVGHTGKSNKILRDHNYEFIKNSPSPFAEQFSINMAVQALCRDEFSNLKTVIIPTIADKIEFAKILFCAILCTDVACQDRLAAVKRRFDAVNRKGTSDEDDSLPIISKKNEDLCPLTPYLMDIYRVLSLTDEDLIKNQDRFITTKACLRHCVVIEHLMQVADVAHCMQGWENFIKWNYRLYKEFMDCYAKDLIPEPSQTWSAGQIAFINNYILPLAERTETCCGLASNLNLAQLAIENRQRWENEGQFITAIFISSVKKGEQEEEVLEKCFANETNYR